MTVRYADNYMVFSSGINIDDISAMIRLPGHHFRNQRLRLGANKHNHTLFNYAAPILTPLLSDTQWSTPQATQNHALQIASPNHHIVTGVKMN